MNPVLATIIDAIKAAEDKGVDMIRASDIRSYLVELDGAIEVEGTDNIAAARMEQYKMELSHWLEKEKYTNQWDFELFRSTISSGQTALRSATLINGGAAVALLAFVGNLWGTRPTVAVELSFPMMLFLYGVLAAALASGATYCAQWFYSSRTNRTRTWGNVFNVLAVLLVAGSFGVFLVGALRATAVFGA